jgi:hypothetical protein
VLRKGLNWNNWANSNDERFFKPYYWFLSLLR